MTAHMFVLRPLRPAIMCGEWWACVCGANGSGANEELAEWQWEQHMEKVRCD